MRKTYSAPYFEHFRDEWHLSPALDAGEFVFFSGITGCRADGSVAENPEAQFRDAFRFLGETLEAAKLGFEDVVEMTTYHVGLRQHLDAFVKVKDEFVKPPYPAWSAIGITELITEGTLAEIRVICRRRGGA
ncbi:RidA family protein [Aquamicrobium sp. LC103]|nr:RidA family protein [Aquamicrobium sp. LC103]